MRYLKKAEFASRLNIGLRTLDRWIAQKKISTRTLITGRIRIPESEIEKCFRPSIQEFLKKSSR
ncbi:MAG: helix-turn-helix domain-containing protein [Candidatus Marinimicrobia bacterium]|nr:helix-turn-helix domain-containing protein [Candidatus Neomarinimicrobiota bacterium]MBT4360975.1 helix-turn-helix domain-containing protein [Candidatus Neomarinimicrobiota bacterium]MBT4714852.1 helix-turn-helix domain-containing protein [Candidatus Neomarinimicrobiota bacterium]MBT4947298.1 helix-turn-helix domain-containing protein [Candidatus Neomarinimicrobiota bacterium]MBT5268205.1 helix-turn-helix domain-containing protein [Candidatus Neomarinimicrobiota bacterium]